MIARTSKLLMLAGGLLLSAFSAAPAFAAATIDSVTTGCSGGHTYVTWTGCGFVHAGWLDRPVGDNYYVGTSTDNHDPDFNYFGSSSTDPEQTAASGYAASGTVCFGTNGEANGTLYPYLYNGGYNPDPGGSDYFAINDVYTGIVTYYWVTWPTC